VKRSRIRYFSQDDFEVGLTRSQLKRASRELQIKYMRFWFAEHFEDPAEETPYSSEEGGYLYIWGGPYDAAEQLGDEFGDIIPEDRIQQVVNYVERDGIVDWAPGNKHPDHQRARDEWAAEHEEDERESPLDQLARLLEGGTVPQFGSVSERTDRQAIIARLEQLNAALASLKPAHGGLGHNNPPDDDGSRGGLIEDAREAGEYIRRELVKDEPDALAVVQATSRLKLALGWFLKKADMAADAFVGVRGHSRQGSRCRGRCICPSEVVAGSCPDCFGRYRHDDYLASERHSAFLGAASFGPQLHGGSPRRARAACDQILCRLH
jgi:hypothetical protein